MIFLYSLKYGVAFVGSLLLMKATGAPYTHHPSLDREWASATATYSHRRELKKRVSNGLETSDEELTGAIGGEGVRGRGRNGGAARGTGISSSASWAAATRASRQDAAGAEGAGVWKVQKRNLEFLFLFLPRLFLLPFVSLRRGKFTDQSLCHLARTWPWSASHTGEFVPFHA